MMLQIIIIKNYNQIIILLKYKVVKYCMKTSKVWLEN
jgi:hypothetical protein